MRLNKRIASLEASATIGFSMKAKAMRQQGEDVISFGAGEPDFDTPEHISEAGIEAIKAGKTRYTPSVGIVELRQAICDKLKRDNELDYEVGQVEVCNGAKHALFKVINSVCDVDDEVIVQAPYWVSYIQQIKACGALPMIVETGAESGYKMLPEQLEQAITSKTKLMVFNSPSNPTGAVYSADECKALAAVCVKHDVMVVSDEIYEKLVYGDAQHFSIAQSSPEMKELCFVINGVSKAYAMTGWRMGYIAGPKAEMAQMARLQDHMTGNISTPTQYAALAALSGDQSCLKDFVELFDGRRQLAMSLLNEIEGLSVSAPDGAFYVFPNVSSFFGKTFGGIQVNNSMDMALALLEQAKVACVPGSAFGSDDAVRLSYACSDDDIRNGIARIREFLMGS